MGVSMLGLAAFLTFEHLGRALAVPILAVFKIVCGHADVLAPLGEFLGPAADR